MGIGDFFKKSFGKQVCSLCGNECGAMRRTKIKGDEFVCNDCKRKCSQFVRLSEMTKDEVIGHIEYMQRQEALYQACFEGAKHDVYPGMGKSHAIAFADELGMFTIIDQDAQRNKEYHELFRYDQVLSYERYEEWEKASEAGKPDVFKEAGIKLRLVGVLDHVELDRQQKGLRPHPYIKREIKVVLRTSEKERDYTENAVYHFDKIFGVRDNQKALLSFGMSKAEKRTMAGAIAFGKIAVEAVKTAKSGEDLSEEKQAEIRENMNKMDDAQTGGLAQYTRLADAAENKVWG